MLKVQEYLKKNGLEKLQSHYKIKVVESPNDNRILLNYNQLDKEHKTSEIVRECRGLCLDKTDFSLISRSFRRFFNYGEWRADVNKFDWEGCIGQEKVDGTLINFFFYNNSWQVCTRGSFGDIPCDGIGPTPKELVFKILGNKINGFDTSLSYSLELCSLYNKVVREYKEPQLFLLAIFDKEEERPFDGLFKAAFSVKNHTHYARIPTPDTFTFSCIEEVEEYIRKRSEEDRTFEGIVLRDKNNNRLKVKNPDYLTLHRIKGASGNIFLPKNLIGWILKGEEDELTTYFAETTEAVNKMKEVMDNEYSLLESTWQKIKHEKRRKEFALSIPSDLKTKAILFKMFEDKGSLKEIWNNSEDFLLKCLF